MRARQTDAPMVQALSRDRQKAWVVAPLPRTEPERLPGTSLSEAASPHRQGRAIQAQKGGRGMEVTHGNYVGIDVAKDRLDVVLRPKRASTWGRPTMSGASRPWCVTSGSRRRL